MTVTHISLPKLEINGVTLQRCGVCGTLIADSRGCAMPLNPDGSPPEFATWAPFRLVQVEEGNPTRYSLLEDAGEALPPDSCFYTLLE